MTPALRQILFRPRAAAAGGGTPATFVGAAATHLSIGANNVTWASLSPPLSPVAGDMVIISLTTGTDGNDETVKGAGAVSYTRLSDLSSLCATGKFCALYYRVLTGGETSVDINVNYTENTTGIAIYRGATTATKKSFTGPVTGDPVMASFPPSGSSAGAVYVAIEDKDGVTPTAMADSPVTLTSRLAERPWSSIQRVADQLSGVVGGSKTLINMNDPAAQKGAWAVELTP